MFELLFCPQHGVFRPENIAMIYIVGQTLFIDAQVYFFKFARFLRF